MSKGKIQLSNLVKKLDIPLIRALNFLKTERINIEINSNNFINNDIASELINEFCINPIERNEALLYFSLEKHIPNKIDFIIGNRYRFKVIDLREENGLKYIYLSDGQKETYRVKPYDFQIEWEDFNMLPKMYCYVKHINHRGLPILVQDKYEVLQHCYPETNKEYSFKLLAISSDSKTDAIIYELKDSFGIRHRFYPHQQRPIKIVGDQFTLLLTDIQKKENNSSHLILYDGEGNSELKNITSKYDNKFHDPREISKFGFENEEKEFKSTIVFPAGSILADIDKQIILILKTIVGFQNNKGGELYLGVNDSGVISGINHDYSYLNSSSTDTFTYQNNKDGYENKIRTAVKHAIGTTSNSNLTFNFHRDFDLDYCIIQIKEVLKPLFLHYSKLYQRAGNMTQLLKGDEITWFIEERLRQRNNSLIFKQPISELVEDLDDETVEPLLLSENIDLTDPEETIQIPQIDNKYISGKIWYNVTFYKNGDWSFQKTLNSTNEVLHELPILNSLKSEKLLMIYDNGCINVVNPFEIINPKTAKGRKLKTEGKLYKNGWNINARLLKVCCVPNNFLISFDMKDKEGKTWTKLHNVNAISVHTSFGLEGNVLVNPRNNVTLVNTYVLPLESYHLISGLVLKDNQTSNYIGYERNNKDFQKTFFALDQLISKYENYWNNSL
jgi:hypothetical protein